MKRDQPARVWDSTIEDSDANQILQRVIATVQDAIVFIDADSNIVLFNGAASQMFGYPSEEALGRPVQLLMGEPHADLHPDYIERYERTGEPRAIGRVRNVHGQRKDGTRFPIELSVAEVDAGPVRYAAVLRDVSIQTRIREELQAQEHMATVGLSASMLAHEVGNPLNNIAVHGQLLQRKIDKLGLQDALRPGVDLIMKEFERLSTLLHDFRMLYRRSSSVPIAVELAPLLDEVLSLQQARATVEGIQIDQHFDPDLPPVRGHTDQLKQVFINLGKNAIEAMPHGGRLAVEAGVTRSGVVVKVRDTGQGIADGIDPFETFYTTKSEGSGLGLVIVRQILSDHGGTISFESEPGHGTVFTVLLPITERLDFD